MKKKKWFRIAIQQCPSTDDQQFANIMLHGNKHTLKSVVKRIEKEFKLDKM